jgi:hypothetical protein
MGVLADFRSMHALDTMASKRPGGTAGAGFKVLESGSGLNGSVPSGSFFSRQLPCLLVAVSHRHTRPSEAATRNMTCTCTASCSSLPVRSTPCGKFMLAAMFLIDGGSLHTLTEHRTWKLR